MKRYVYAYTCADCGREGKTSRSSGHACRPKRCAECRTRRANTTWSLRMRGAYGRGKGGA